MPKIKSSYTIKASEKEINEVIEKYFGVLDRRTLSNPEKVMHTLMKAMVSDLLIEKKALGIICDNLQSALQNIQREIRYARKEDTNG